MNTNQSVFRRAFFGFQLVLLIFAFAAATVFAAGEVDPTFDTAVQHTYGGRAYKTIVQPDGKLLVAGEFAVAGNVARSGIARFNVDGTVDTTFSPPPFYRSNVVLSNAVFYAVALQSDGKIIVGGVFDQIGNLVSKGVARLNADGSLDSTFDALNGPVYNGASGIIYDIKIQPDNKILLGGNFEVYGGTHPGFSLHKNLARFNPNGSIDESFNPADVSGFIETVALAPDGKVLFTVDNSNEVRRANPDGTRDISFLVPVLSNVNKLTVQSGGKILVARESGNGITRLNADGTVDSTFNQGGAGTNGAVRDFITLPDGKILIGGSFTSYNGVAKLFIARLNSDGTLDTTFFYSGGNIASVSALALLNDGSYIAALLTEPLALTNNKLIRISPSGARDPNYAGDFFVRQSVSKVFVQPNGKILVGGLFKKVNGVPRLNIARLNADGTLDSGFNASVEANSTNAVLKSVYTIVAQADGKVLVGGTFIQANDTPKLSLARFNVDGSLDTTFQTALVNPGINPNDSAVYEIIPLSDGKILIAGKFRLSQYNFDLSVARLNADGTTDNSFIQNQVSTAGTVYTMKLQTDGKIVVGGRFTQIAGATRRNIARLNADGTIDANFAPDASSDVYDLAIQSNGNIVVGGAFSGIAGFGNHFYLAQLFPNGNLNQAFNTLVNNFVYAVERQSDDKILVGSFFNIDGKRGIARFNADGTLDNSFAGIGTNDNVRDIFIQSDNNILIGGDFTRVNNVSRVGVARLLNAAAPTLRTPYDFDGDGRADISVFRPSNGTWYLQRSQAGFAGFAFGQTGDLITPGDYDGDGKTDIAVFRPSNGVWYIQRSSQGFTAAAFGANGDIPMPGDFDGDGKADLAVFRPSNGVWYLQQSQAGFVGYAFGQAGDKPIAADYDGDGKADLAVFRPSNGTWYLQRSTQGFTAVTFGAGTDNPVPADYNGDGRADIAIFRPSTGYWYTSTDPATNYGATLFGQAGDLPVPADYDGDGKADLAVFRPSNGVWYLQRSTQGFTGVLFGISEDKPAPNAFIR